MSQVRDLLVEQLQDLLHAETQLTAALPKMVEAANHPKLKEAFQKHLIETKGQVERLRTIFQQLGTEPESTPCKAMKGLIEEGQETMDKGEQKDALAADLALIAAAQRVEHYEISAYGTARAMARQIGEINCAQLLSHTLGEEESADFLLTAIADPLMQQATLDDAGASVNLENGEKRQPLRSKTARPKEPKEKELAKAKMA